MINVCVRVCFHIYSYKCICRRFAVVYTHIHVGLYLRLYIYACIPVMYADDYTAYIHVQIAHTYHAYKRCYTTPRHAHVHTHMHTRTKVAVCV